MMNYSIEMNQSKASFAQKLVQEQIDMKNYNLQQIAKLLKETFDKTYGIGWQCIVGNSFGCYITHLPNSFLYFSVEYFSVILFRTNLTIVIL
uniref:Dynein light chain n=2 Tax=Wuchereria bancrofti TaxID=6293 RepID=A0AAF5PW10_WUCBA